MDFGTLNCDFFKNIIKKFGIYILIFIIAIISRIAIINYYDNVQVDEPATFVSISASNTLPDGTKKTLWCGFPLKKMVEYRMSDFYKYLFIVNNDKKHIIDDLKQIRNQKMDNCHPSLYYGILRLWFIGCNDSDYKSLLLRARLLNIAFFALAFFFMYKLLNLICKNRTNIPLGLIFAFFSTGSLSLSLLAREYELQSALLIATTYLYSLLIKKIISKDYITQRNIISTGIISGLFLLSGYFSGIYLSIFIIATCLLCLKYKNYLSFLKILFILILAIAIVMILCPNYFWIYKNSSNARGVFQNLSNIFDTEKYKHTIANFLLCTKKYLLYPAVFLVALLSFFTNIKQFFYKTIKNLNAKYVFLLVIISFSTFIFLLAIITYDNARYILPLFPILSLVYILLLDNTKLWLKIVIMVFFLTMTVYKVSTDQYYDKGDRGPYFTVIKTFDYPVVIHKSYWPVIIYTFLHSENNNIILRKNKLPGEIFMNKYKKIILFTNDKLKPNEYESFINDFEYSRIYTINKKLK